MAKVGDIVRFLNSVGGGRINRIKDNIAYVEEEDGFETPVMLRECVVVASGDSQAPKSKPQHTASPAPEYPSKDLTPPAPAPVKKPEEEVIETPTGEKLNVVIGYEPVDIKRLSETDYDVYLVNDSNFFLYFTYMVKSDFADGWTVKFAGMVEPNIQILIDEMPHADLPQMDKIAVQYIAFKQGREFALKSPASVEWRVDTTKFFKLHCFHRNPYFENDVIAYDIVTDDVPARRMPLDPKALEKGIKEKKAATRPVKKPVTRRAAVPDSLVVDLHIAELTDSTRGLSNADMLNMQVDKFREVMDANMAHPGMKIVFIHGKGEGVLRQALLKELNYRYKSCDVQDASFREYGYGATQVTIHK